MAPLDDEERSRARAAMVRLQCALTAVAQDVVARIDERCPYRAREDRCTFAQGCRNQRREPAAPGERAVWCAGDHQLRRTIR